MMESKCKAPWCKNEYTGPEPSGYCCFLHRELHNFEAFNDELDTEEVSAIKREWRSLYDEVRKLRPRVEVLESQLRAYEKALEWYANQKHWVEQVDDRGRETMRWRWADDDGRMARYALDCWRQSEAPKLLPREGSEGFEK